MDNPHTRTQKFFVGWRILCITKNTKIDWVSVMTSLFNFFLPKDYYMSVSIDNVFVKQFEADVHLAYQQMGTKLRSTVRSKSGVRLLPCEKGIRCGKCRHQESGCRAFRQERG